MAADVFISYSREDREIARLVAGALEADGFSVWWDAALRAGETYDEVTEHNLRNAGAVVVLWSKRSSNSKWVRAEATVGERSTSLVPALIEDCERPIRFELVQTADLRHWQGDRADPQWREFIQDIRTAVSRRESKPAAVPTHAADTTVETAFWNSIKDSADRSDFEAYLGRYPNGHFAALAANRVAALDRGAAAPSRQAAARPAASRPAPPRPPQAQASSKAIPPSGPPQQAARPAPQAARTSPPHRQAASSDNKKSGGGLIAGGIVLGVLVLAAVGFMLISGGRDAANTTAAEVASTEANVTAGNLDGAAPTNEATVNSGADGPAQEVVTTDLEADQDASVDEAYTTDVLATNGDEGASDAKDLAEAAPSDGDIITAASLDEELAAQNAAAVAAVTDTPAPAANASKTFKDCPDCPEMVRLTGGVFQMGSPWSEPGRNGYEGPQHEVTVPPFAIGAYEVTNSQWDACAKDGACAKKGAASDPDKPVLYLSWNDAQDYVRWLSKTTGRKYRLPSEAEWEFAARGGATTAYWWGDKFDRSRVAVSSVQAVGAHGANAFGLYDLLGNAREWVEDCYINNYTNTPTDGSPDRSGDCSLRVIRGGAWSSPAADMRVANRSRISKTVSARYMGMRVASEAE